MVRKSLGDPEALRVVFDNLISNAVKFAPGGSRLEVVAATTASSVVVDVCDCGPGIAADERAQVFEPFFQGRTQPTGPIRGTGLGLAIAKDLLGAQGGSIEIIDSTQGGHLRVVLRKAAPSRSNPID